MPDDTDSTVQAGLEAYFIENRERLIRFLRARGAEEPEDLVQEIWLKIARSTPGPVASPAAYIFRMADSVMIDRYRSVQRSRQRESDWVETQRPAGDETPTPTAEDRLAAIDEASRVMAMLDALGPRVAGIFRRHRVDGIAQKRIAAEFGVSLSTVEGDLRSAYRALRDWKERRDEV